MRLRQCFINGSTIIASVRFCNSCAIWLSATDIWFRVIVNIVDWSIVLVLQYVYASIPTHSAKVMVYASNRWRPQQRNAPYVSIRLNIGWWRHIHLPTTGWPLVDNQRLSSFVDQRLTKHLVLAQNLCDRELGTLFIALFNMKAMRLICVYWLMSGWTSRATHLTNHLWCFLAGICFGNGDGNLANQLKASSIAVHSHYINQFVLAWPTKGLLVSLADEWRISWRWYITQRIGS